MKKTILNVVAALTVCVAAQADTWIFHDDTIAGAATVWTDYLMANYAAGSLGTITASTATTHAGVSPGDVAPVLRETSAAGLAGASAV